jgi:hypothetical protein
LPFKETKLTTTITSKRFRGPGEKMGSSSAGNAKKAKRNYIVCKYCGFQHAPSAKHEAAACNKNLPPDKQFISHHPAKIESVGSSSSSSSSTIRGYSVVANMVRGLGAYIGYSD